MSLAFHGFSHIAAFLDKAIQLKLELIPVISKMLL